MNTPHSFIHSSVDGHCVASPSWLLGEWEWRYLFETLLSILLGVYPEVKLLDHMAFYFNCLRKLHTLFRSSYTILQLLQQCTKVLISLHPPHILDSIGYFLFCFYNSHPNGCTVISHGSDSHFSALSISFCISLT